MKKILITEQEYRFLKEAEKTKDGKPNGIEKNYSESGDIK